MLFRSANWWPRRWPSCTQLCFDAWLTDDLAHGIIAKQIVELAKPGERNPDLLCEAALKKLHGICIATSTLRAKRRASPLGLASLLLSLAVCRSRMNCGTHLKGSH